MKVWLVLLGLVSAFLVALSLYGTFNGEGIGYCVIGILIGIYGCLVSGSVLWSHEEVH